MVLAVDTQFNFSVVEINSVGLKSGFFASLAAWTLSSNFLEIVDLMVFAAGTSISSVAVLFWSMVDLAGAAVVVVVVVVVEVVEELEDEDEDDEEVEEEQVLESESESLWFVVCPGMLPSE